MWIWTFHVVIVFNCMWGRNGNESTLTPRNFSTWVMRVHSHQEIFQFIMTLKHDKGDESTLTPRNFVTWVMRVHSHQEIFQFICDIEARQGFDWGCWHKKVVFILQDDEYSSQVSYGEYPEEWREHFEHGDSGFVSVTERYCLHLSILMQYLRIVEVSTESVSDICFWRRRRVEYSSQRLSSIFWQWARAADDILSIPRRYAWWCCLASSPFVGAGLLGEYKLNCTHSDSQCPS